MDFRCKTEIKDEPFFESNKDYAHVSQVEETLNIFQEERSCDDNVNVKSEIEFEDDPLDIKEEEPSTDQLFGQISELDEKNTNQTVFVFSDAYQGNKGSKGRSNLGSGLQTSETPDQNFKNNHEKNQSWSFSNFGCKSKDMLESSERYKCSYCSYECNFKSYLDKHLLIHSDVKLLKCAECNYECKRKESIKLHIRNKHSNIKLFKCLVCNYQSNHITSLNSHFLKHTNIKLFKCSECNYECNLKQNLKSHMLIHGDRLFKCSECSYECKRKQSLKNHMFKHRNVKLIKSLFKCSECSYDSKTKSTLKAHMLLHQNVREKMEIHKPMEGPNSGEKI